MLYAVGIIKSRTKRKNDPVYGFKLYNTKTNSFEYIDRDSIIEYNRHRGTKIENLIINSDENNCKVRGKYYSVSELPSYYVSYKGYIKEYFLLRKSKTVVILQQDVDDETDNVIRFHAVDSEKGYFIIDNAKNLKAVMNNISNAIVNGTKIDIKCRKNRVVNNKITDDNGIILDTEAINKDIDWSLLRFMQYYSQKINDKGENTLNKIYIKAINNSGDDFEVKPSNIKEVAKVTEIFIDISEFRYNILHLPCGVDKVKIKLDKNINLESIIVGKRTDKLEIVRDINEDNYMIKVKELHIMSDSCAIQSNSICYLDIDNYSIKEFKNNQINNNFNFCNLPYILQNAVNNVNIRSSFNNTVLKEKKDLNIFIGQIFIGHKLLDASFNNFNNFDDTIKLKVEYKNNDINKNSYLACIRHSFNDCKGLELDNITIDGISKIENSFRNIRIRDSIDLEKTIKNTNSLSLKQSFNQTVAITVSKINLTNKINALISSFYNVDTINKMDLPKSIKYIDESSFKNGLLTWNTDDRLNSISHIQRGISIEYNTHLTNDGLRIDKNEANYLYKDIMGYDFKYNSDMNSELINLPDNTKEICAFAYKESNLKYIEGNGVERIGEGALFLTELSEFNSLDFPSLKRLDYAFLGSNNLTKVVLAHNIEYANSEILFNIHYGIDKIKKEDDTLDYFILKLLNKNLKDIVIADTVKLDAPILPVNYNIIKKLNIETHFKKLSIHVVKNSSAHKVYSRLKESNITLIVYEDREELYRYNHVTKELKEKAINNNMMIKEFGDLTDNESLNKCLLQDEYINNALKIVETYEELNTKSSEDSFIKFKESKLYSEELNDKVKNMFYKNPLKINWSEDCYNYNKLEKVDSIEGIESNNIKLHDEPIQLVSYLNLIRMILKRDDNLIELDEEDLSKYLVQTVDASSEFNNGKLRSQFADLLYNKNDFRIEILALNKIMGCPEETYDAVRINYMCLIYAYKETDYILYMTPVGLDTLSSHLSILNYSSSGLPVIVKSDYNISTLRELYSSNKINNKKCIDALAEELKIGDSSIKYNEVTINKIKYPNIAGNIFNEAFNQIILTDMIIVPLNINTKITKKSIQNAVKYINDNIYSKRSIRILEGTEYLAYNLVNQKFYILTSFSSSIGELATTKLKSEYEDVDYIDNNIIGCVPYIESNNLIELTDIKVSDIYNTGDIHKHKNAIQLLKTIKDNNLSLYDTNFYKFFIIKNKEQKELYNKCKEENMYRASNIIETDEYFKISTAVDRIVSAIGYKRNYNIENECTELELNCYCIEKLFKSPLSTKLSETKLLTDEEKEYIKNELNVCNSYKLSDGVTLEEYKYTIYKVYKSHLHSNYKEEYNVYLYKYNNYYYEEYSDTYILPDTINNIVKVLVENQNDIIYRYYSYNNSKFRFYQREQEEDIVILINEDINLVNSIVYPSSIKHQYCSKMYTIEGYGVDRVKNIRINIALDKESEELYLVARKETAGSDLTGYYKLFRFKDIEKALIFLDRLIFKNDRAIISIIGLIRLFEGKYYSCYAKYTDNGMHFKDELINILYRLQFDEYTPNMPELLQINILNFIELFNNNL